MNGGKGWAKPGEASNLFRWNMSRGGKYTAPGKMPSRQDEQINLPRLPSDWSPSAAPKYRVQVSKPGTVPPADAWNFTPDTGEFTPPGRYVSPEDASQYTQVSPIAERAEEVRAVPLPNAPTLNPADIIRMELATPNVEYGSDVELLKEGDAFMTAPMPDKLNRDWQLRGNYDDSVQADTIADLQYQLFGSEPDSSLAWSDPLPPWGQHVSSVDPGIWRGGLYNQPSDKGYIHRPRPMDTYRYMQSIWGLRPEERPVQPPLGQKASLRGDVGVGEDFEGAPGEVPSMIYKPRTPVPTVSARGTAPSSRVPTTVDISGGRTSNTDTSSLKYQILSLSARYGLPTRVVEAILITEGGLAGDVGDRGFSFGPFQFYGGGGQLNNFAAQYGFGKDWRSAGQYILKNPLVAADWALRPGGYLGDTIRSGMSQGIQGADLATYAQKYGQVSVTPERAGRVYNSISGTPVERVDPRSVHVPAGSRSPDGVLVAGPKVQGLPLNALDKDMKAPSSKPAPPLDPGAWGEDLTDTVWSELGAGYLADKSKIDVDMARELYQDPVLAQFKTLSLDMARRGDLNKYLPEGMSPGVGQDRRRGWGRAVGMGQGNFADYAGERLGESWRQISQPQQWYDPIMGALGAVGLPFEPLSAGARYLVGSAGQALTGAEDPRYDPDSSLEWFERNVPLPLQMLTELAVPVPPIAKLGKLGKLGKWGKALEGPKPKKGWLGAVERAGEDDDLLLGTQGVRLPSGKEIDVAKGGRKLSVSEDLDRLEREAELWAAGKNRQALETSFSKSDVGSAIGKPVPSFDETMAGKYPNLTRRMSQEPPAPSLSEMRPVQEFDPMSIVPERRGYERGGYSSPSMAEKGKMGKYLSTEAAEFKAARMLGVTPLEEFSKNAPKIARVLSNDVLEAGYVSSEGKLILFPRHLEEIVSRGGYETRLDKLIQAIVPDKDVGKMGAAYDDLLIYLADKGSPVMIDLRHGSLEPLEFLDMQRAVLDPKKAGKYMLPEIKTQKGTVSMPKITGLDEDSTRILHNWRGGRKNPSSMQTVIGGELDPKDLEAIRPDLAANKARRKDFALAKGEPKTEKALESAETVKTLFPEDVTALGAGLEKELWKYGIGREKAAQVAAAAAEGRSARILHMPEILVPEIRMRDKVIRPETRIPEGMYVDFPAPASTPNVVEVRGKTFRAVPDTRNLQPEHLPVGITRTGEGPFRPGRPGEGEELRIPFKPASEEKISEVAREATKRRKTASQTSERGNWMDYEVPDLNPEWRAAQKPGEWPYAGPTDWMPNVGGWPEEVARPVVRPRPDFAPGPGETGHVEKVRPVSQQWPKRMKKVDAWDALTEGETASKLSSAAETGGKAVAGGEIGRIEAQLSSLRKQWAAAKTAVQRKAIEDGAAKLKKQLVELEGPAAASAGIYTASGRQEMVDSFMRRMAARAGRLREEDGDGQEE